MGAEHVGDGERRQIGRMQRSLDRLLEPDGWPVGQCGELQGQQHRRGDERGHAERHDREHGHTFAHITHRAVRSRDFRDRERREKNAEE